MVGDIDVTMPYACYALRNGGETHWTRRFDEIVQVCG